MQPHRQSASLTLTLVLASTIWVLAVSLALVAAALFMLTHLQPPRIVILTIF